MQERPSSSTCSKEEVLLVFCFPSISFEVIFCKSFLKSFEECFQGFEKFFEDKDHPWVISSQKRGVERRSFFLFWCIYPLSLSLFSLLFFLSLYV